MIKILFTFLLSFILLSSIPFVIADDEQNSEYEKIINPDVHIDFSDDMHWEGLSADSDYWKIHDGEGHFMLYSEIQQLNSATFDLLPHLESEIADDWVLRYKLTLENYKQGNNPAWSELLIGLSNDSANSITPQWGVGVGFLNGAKIKFTNLMYDFGTYNEWHCCPIKAQFQNEKSLPGQNKTWWVEYIKENEKFTVRIFDDANYEKLIEQKSVGGSNAENLRFLKIYPLVEDNSVNGFMSGKIDDIKFYNRGTTVSQSDEKLPSLTLKPETMSIPLEKSLGDSYTTPIPHGFDEIVSLWANGIISDKKFYSTVKDLVINERMLVEELSRAYGQKLDLTYKPQTIIIPKDDTCSSCIVENFVNIKWELPEGLPENASAIIDILTPSGENVQLTTSSKIGSTFRITSESSTGLYEISVTYANKKFPISPLLLTDEKLPKIPFWVKYNSQKWANGELPESEFVDSLIFLIQNGQITFNHEIFVKKEPKITSTPQEILETFLPTQDEITAISPDLPPPIWEYLVTSDALRLVNMDYTSIQKILEDKSRTYDPIYGKYDVPFTMMQIYQFDSNEKAKKFIEEQIWTNNVLMEGRVSGDELVHSDYSYNRIFENADMSGTSDTTGDCLYRLTPNNDQTVMDETHFLQCVLNEKIIQIYLFEDYHIVDKKFSFALMDIILKNINDITNIQSVEHILTLNNISNSQQSTLQPSNDNSEQTDPEIFGSSVGINNFVCKKDDFGTINMEGQFVNGENSFEKVKVDITIESYDGVVLATGSDYVLKINPYETRTIDGYVFVDEPFHKCFATVDWDNSN